MIYIGIAFVLFNVDAISLALELQNLPKNIAYSSAYLGDWSKLPDDKMIAKKISSYVFNKVLGDVYQRKYIYYKNITNKTLHLKNMAFKIRWKRKYNKYKNTFILIRGYKKVVIENIAIIQMDSDYRASHSILVEDCGEVIIKNCYFSGTNNNYHLRIEGCKNVFIDGIEIAGYSYGKLGIRCGGGILINNGDPKMGGKHGMVSPNPMDMQLCVVQNCYVHGAEATDIKRNQDGINIQSAADGMVFNCYFENWKVNDAALDISHRRTDLAYKKHTFRIERNKFINCKTVKTAGTSDKSCKMVFANNIYHNTYFTDYHNGGWDVYHINETFYFDKKYDSKIFYKTYGLKNGKTYFSNCMIFNKKKFHTLFFLSGQADLQDMLMLKLDYCLYFIIDPVYWVKTLNKDLIINNFNDWKKTTTSDRHSKKVRPNSCFINQNKINYDLLNNCPEGSDGTGEYLLYPNMSLRVDRDYNGIYRKNPPSIGAFENKVK